MTSHLSTIFPFSEWEKESGPLTPMAASLFFGYSQFRWVENKEGDLYAKWLTPERYRQVMDRLVEQAPVVRQDSTGRARVACPFCGDTGQQGYGFLHTGLRDWHWGRGHCGFLQLVRCAFHGTRWEDR